MPRIRKKGENAKPKNLIKTLKRIFFYMSNFKLQLFFVIITILVSAFAKIVGTAFLEIVIDKYITPLAKNDDVKLLKGFMFTIIWLAIIYIIGVFSTYVYNRIMISISENTMYKIRKDLFEKMEKLPIKYFDTHIHGDTMSLYTNDIDAVKEMLSESFTSCVFSLISIVGIFAMMIYYSWQLTLLVFVMIAVMLVCGKRISIKSAKYFIDQQNELGKLNGFIEEIFEGQKVVKVFCHEKKTEENFNELNEKLCDVSTKANAYANILMPVMVNLSDINYSIISIVGGILVILGKISLGTIVAFLQYTRSFVHPITEISQQFNSVLSALAGAERIFNVIDQKPEIDNGTITIVNVKNDKDNNLIETNDKNSIYAWKIENNGVVEYKELKGKIKFKDVVFFYEKNKTILTKINLVANAGHKIALVGSTGAGKTTIINLINRFYDVCEGEITIDDININDVKKNDLRKVISIVLQDTNLFTETIMENIRYGKLNTTDDEVISSAKLANADDFINNLENNYKTVLKANGSNLSQGERQLLAIARALIADSPILILDEATSSIDTRTEKLIEKGMDVLMKDKTVFIIAHRLSTVRNADLIVVLENGEIIEQGNHNELLKKKGRYYQLYNGISELE